MQNLTKIGLGAALPHPLMYTSEDGGSLPLEAHEVSGEKWAS